MDTLPQSTRYVHTELRDPKPKEEKRTRTPPEEIHQYTLPCPNCGEGMQQIKYKGAAETHVERTTCGERIRKKYEEVIRSCIRTVTEWCANQRMGEDPKRSGGYPPTPLTPHLQSLLPSDLTSGLFKTLDRNRTTRHTPEKS